MSRLTQGVVLLLLGGAVTRTTLSGAYLRYVKHGLQPFLIVAGVLLILAGLMTIVYELRGDKEHDDGHGHAHEPRVGWLLLLPVIGLLLIAPPALGSYAASQAGTVVAQNAGSDYPPLPAGNPVQVGLLDYASRAIFDNGHSLAGRTIELTGFVTPGADKQPMLARIVLTCCAADGRPIKVGLSGSLPAAEPTGTWIDVIGTYSTQIGKDPVNQASIAYFAVKSWQEIAQPEQPYA